MKKIMVFIVVVFILNSFNSYSQTKVNTKPTIEEFLNEFQRSVGYREDESFLSLFENILYDTDSMEDDNVYKTKKADYFLKKYDDDNKINEIYSVYGDIIKNLTVDKIKQPPNNCTNGMKEKFNKMKPAIIFQIEFSKKDGDREDGYSFYFKVNKGKFKIFGVYSFSYQ